MASALLRIRELEEQVRMINCDAILINELRLVNAYFVVVLHIYPSVTGQSQTLAGRRSAHS